MSVVGRSYPGDFPSTGVRRFFLLVCLALTGVMWLHAARQVAGRLEFLAAGVEAEAVLIGYRDRDTVVAAFVVDDPARVVRADLRYTTPFADLGNNAKRPAIRKSPREPSRNLRLQVLYLPDQPEQALLLPPQRWMLWATPPLWILFGSLPLIALFSLRRLYGGGAGRAEA